MKKLILILFVLILCIVTSTHAGLYGESVQFEDLHDQRTFSHSPDYDPDQSEGGLSGNWPYSFNISWDISYDFTSMLWHYEYNLSVSKKDISHFILELSDTAQYADISNVRINGKHASIEGPKTWKKAGNQQLSQSFYGMKFDDGGSSVIYSFDTALDPVWGNFYVKGGNDRFDNDSDSGDSDDSDSDSDDRDGHWRERHEKEEHGKREKIELYAYNNALGFHEFNSEDKLDFIVRPNGGSNPPVVPEPISSALFITGGATIGLRRFLKKRKAS